MSRSELLSQLIECSVPVPQAIAALSAQSWDACDDLVQLVRRHCEHVLELFVRGDLTTVEVEAWANAIECREDIGVELSAGGVLHELANPLLIQPLTTARAQFLLSGLQNAG
jgi:hypothetical protein